MAVELCMLEALLSGAFPGGRVQVDRLVNDDDHYKVSIAFSGFAGKSKLEQHRMVYDALAGVEIHALQIQTSVVYDEQ